MAIPASQPPDPSGLRMRTAQETHRPTIDDVAQLAGVSRGTVSRVLNGGRHVRPAVKASVHVAIETLGYSVNQAARNLAAGRTGSVAFVLSERQEHLFEDPELRAVRQDLRQGAAPARTTPPRYCGPGR